MRRGILIAATSFALVQVSFAQQKSAQSQGDMLLEKARSIEDIRSSNAPPFRLTVTFSFTGDDLEPAHGTYTETWISDSKWKQETVVGDQRSIVVAGPGKHWLLIPQDFPRKAAEIPLVWTFLPAPFPKLDFESIDELAGGRLTADCAFTSPDFSGLRSAFCFEKETGLLLQLISPEKRPRNVVSFSCSYGTFRKFGAYIFPREVVCSEDQHKSIRADVVGLSFEPTTEASWFQPPPDAIEVPECTGKLVKPYLVSREFANPTFGS